MFAAISAVLVSAVQVHAVHLEVRALLVEAGPKELDALVAGGPHVFIRLAVDGANLRASENARGLVLAVKMIVRNPELRGIRPDDPRLPLFRALLANARAAHAALLQEGI